MHVHRKLSLWREYMDRAREKERRDGVVRAAQSVESVSVREVVEEWEVEC